jgi:hypothetical protein
VSNTNFKGAKMSTQMHCPLNFNTTLAVVAMCSMSRMLKNENYAKFILTIRGLMVGRELWLT